MVAQHLSSLIPCCLGKPLHPGLALATNVQGAADIQTPTESQQSGASASWPVLAAAKPHEPHSLVLMQPAGADLAILALVVRGLHQANMLGCWAELGRQQARSLGLAQPGGEDLVVLALVVAVLHQALVEALGQVHGLLAALLLLARLVCRLFSLLPLLQGITCSMSTSEQRLTYPLTCKQLIQHELT